MRVGGAVWAAAFQRNERKPTFSKKRAQKQTENQDIFPRPPFKMFYFQQKTLRPAGLVEKVRFRQDLSILQPEPAGGSTVLGDPLSSASSLAAERKSLLCISVFAILCSKHLRISLLFLDCLP